MNRNSKTETARTCGHVPGFLPLCHPILTSFTEGSKNHVVKIEAWKVVFGTWEAFTNY